MSLIKKTFVSLFVVILFCGLPQNAKAVVDPFAKPNNHFGIHILNEGDIDAAASLVNSNGDWGYVTLVIQDNERNISKWQAIFDSFREKHLIPIVRIATHPEDQNWVKPAVGEAPAWASFLDSLNWVTKNRYVVLFNEPNHAKEWGGQIAPSEYADVLTAYSSQLKEQNGDFFILNAGFDSSAPNGTATRDEAAYLRGMLSHNPKVFDNLDGWVSHSYPNPNFSSSPLKTGRGSIKSYEWELNLLKSFGITKVLPVLITETGWSNGGMSETTVAENLKTAYEKVWNDPKVLAVTPFVLNYQAEPFGNFSWKKADGFKEQYKTVQALQKTKGAPEQIEKIVILDGLPEKFTTSNFYFFTLSLQNLGQTIWDKNDGYGVSIETQNLESTKTDGVLEKIVPFKVYKTGISIKTPSDPGDYVLKVILTKNGQTVSETAVAIIISKPAPQPQDPPKNHLKNFIGFLFNKFDNWTKSWHPVNN